MASGAWQSAMKGRKSTAISSSGEASISRQRQVAVGLRPPVAGHVLDHRQHAAGKRALDHGAAEVAHDVGVEAEGAVADDVVRAGLRHVEHRRAVDGNAGVAKLGGNQPGAGKGGGSRGLRIEHIEIAIDPRRRHLRAIAAGAGAAPGRLPGR